MRSRLKASKDGSLTIVCLSDTHRLHRDVSVPIGDLLIHAGDICHMGENKESLTDFNKWLGELPHTLKVCVPGNHDEPLETDPSIRSEITNAVLLINEGCEFKGLRLWGSPITALGGGAFGVQASHERRRFFSQIPSNTDILITHEAPFGILDSDNSGRYHSGDPELLDAVRRLDLKMCVFGHHHLGHGVLVAEGTVYVNAALLGPGGGIEWDPIVLRMPKTTGLRPRV